MRRPPTAPDDLELPDYVRQSLGRRQSSVLDHGFDEATIGTTWWDRELTRHGASATVQMLDHKLTRSDLFRLGHNAAADPTDDDALLALLWNTLAWGTGRSQRGNRRRIDAVLDPERREHNVALLQTAAASARDGQPAEAYRALVRRGGTAIRGLGPAFFTKFLYFASEGTPGTRCLILDARVAHNLARDAGWRSLPHRGNNYSYNWYTDTYVSYCELLERWAAEESSERGIEISPDEIERALFAGEVVE